MLGLTATVEFSRLETCCAGSSSGFWPRASSSWECCRVTERSIRTRRREAGWTQVELARAARVNKRTVIRLERSEPCSLVSRNRVENALRLREESIRSLMAQPEREP